MTAQTEEKGPKNNFKKLKYIYRDKCLYKL